VIGSQTTAQRHPVRASITTSPWPRYTGVIDFKDYSLAWKAGVRDFERGQQDHIVADHCRPTLPSAMQLGYIEHDTFKSPSSLSANSSTS